jgi:hypothetical protein
VQVDDRGSLAGADSLDLGSNWSRLVEIRCSFAELARREAEAAEERVAQTRLQLDAQLAILVSAQTAVDPRATRAAKEEAHQTFRKAIGRATMRDQVEMAAASWLAEINRVNGAVRGAQTRIQRERDATDALAAELDRLTAIAEASRAMAESAVGACREAREALAASQGQEVAAVAGDPSSGSAAGPIPEPQVAQTARAQTQPAVTPAAPTPATTPAFGIRKAGATGVGASPASIGASPASIGASPTSIGVAAGAAPQLEEPGAPVELRGPKPPMIVRLLQQDGTTMSRLVDWLAGPDAEQRRRWQLCLSDFVDAVVATAIDNGCFVFTAGNAFWDQLTVDEAREVARGLAALGFRYDGMGGFADGRVPGQRELSMALGQAGLLTVRVRNWPRPEEAAQLYRHVRVDPIALLAERAPSITMGELVLMLGRRAEAVADLWNDWPRARPLLLLPGRE